MAGVVRRRVRITGQVQGVFFRASCQEQARRLGVAGWVRNAADGSVDAAFEGDEPAVETLIDWCRIGPIHAEVADVEVTPEAPVGERSFAVR